MYAFDIMFTQHTRSGVGVTCDTAEIKICYSYDYLVSGCVLFQISDCRKIGILEFDQNF
jgi:hypothetical protein